MNWGRSLLLTKVSTRQPKVASDFRITNTPAEFNCNFMSCSITFYKGKDLLLGYRNNAETVILWSFLVDITTDIFRYHDYGQNHKLM